MKSTITYREPTKDELDIMKSESRHSKFSIFFLILLCLATCYVFYMFLGWIGGFINDQVGRWCSFTGIAIGLLIYIKPAIYYKKRAAKSIEEAKQDLELGKVQDIEVWTDRVDRIVAYSDNEPILCFQISPEQCLFLQGQWLWDSHTYEPNEEPDYDLDDECTMNGFIDDRGFPNGHFILTRMFNHGRVLCIKILGQFLRQENETIVFKPEYDYKFKDSEIMDGSLEDIEMTLQRHYEKKRLDAGSSPA